MIVIINGQKKNIGDARNVATLMKAEGYEGKTVAVARNGTFVQRDLYAQTCLEDGDEIDIVAPMQGG